MTLIDNLVRVNDEPRVRIKVAADYSFNNEIFQIRAYKQGDTRITKGQTQNIQIDRNTAIQIVGYLKEFIQR